MIMSGEGGTGDSRGRPDSTDSLLEELRRERTARLAAERSARLLAELHQREADRAAWLLAVTAAFSEARAPVDVANAVLTQGCAALGAPRGLVALLTADGAALEVLGTMAHADEGVRVGQRLPLSDAAPLTDAVRLETALFLESTAIRSDRYPNLRSPLPGGDHAVIAVPLLVAGRSLGGICFSFEDGGSAPRPPAETSPRRGSHDGGVRRFDAAERSLVLTLARLCAQALDRACLYEAAAHARAEAEAANRAKDDFLSTLSHELRTPLMSILGWANILRTRKLEPEAVARALATIERSARTQSQLVEDILDVSRIVAQKLRLEIGTVDPAAIVRAAIEVVRPSADAKQVSIETSIDEDIGVMRADPGRLQQIAWNLLANAVKFTPKGGRVEVRLSLGDDSLRLRVIDSGEGIAPEFLPHVFERFRQADGSGTRSHGGLGLGLAIARHLVELHDGTITAESRGLGRGATFTVTLPIPPSTEGEPRSSWVADRLTPLAARLDGVRIVVVDDEPDALELIAAILRAQGATVTVAASAPEALRAIELSPPDVLVSDIGLPHLDGYALLQKVRAMESPQRRQIPALALTAYAGAHDARMAERAGFQRHLAKPFTPLRLIDEVWLLAGLHEVGGRFTS